MAIIKRRTNILILFIIASVLLLTKCIGKATKEKDTGEVAGFDQFAGSAKCAGCHSDVLKHYLETAHYLTSQPSDSNTVKGSFSEGSNIFRFTDHTRLMMEKRDSGYYQVEYVDQKEIKARRFDITVGSGTRGQTYLYWWGDTLFQLPLTYFTATHEWTNSPGYPNRVAFGRPVTARCLECHSTFVQTVSSDGAFVDEFDRNKIIYGVNCEKCHGPALKHVQYHTANPGEKKAKYIINPASFSREQSIDLCALCHGGRLSKTRPSFSFQAGNRLKDYFLTNPQNNIPENIDVHGNQYGLLSLSKCYTLSQMTCITCHNVHENEKNRVAVFSQRCISCHTASHEKECTLKNTLGMSINQNCISCHMPEQPSGAIVVLRQGETTPTSAYMHTHYIKAYPEETKKVLAYFNKMKKLPG